MTNINGASTSSPSFLQASVHLPVQNEVTQPTLQPFFSYIKVLQNCIGSHGCHLLTRHNFSRITLLTNSYFWCRQVRAVAHSLVTHTHSEYLSISKCDSLTIHFTTFAILISRMKCATAENFWQLPPDSSHC